MEKGIRMHLGKSCLAFWIIVVVGVACCTSLAEDVPDYRQAMRSFVCAISKTAKGVDLDFIVIPQNGEALLTKTGQLDEPLVQDYLEAIDGIGREELFYGYAADNKPTPEAVQAPICPSLILQRITDLRCWLPITVGAGSTLMPLFQEALSAATFLSPPIIGSWTASQAIPNGRPTRMPRMSIPFLRCRTSSN